MQQSQLDSSIRNHLPHINQIIINKEFIGIATELQEKRRQRKSIDQVQKTLQNRVSSLEREQIKANKQIREKQAKLVQLLAIRKRQQENKLLKESLARSREKQIDLLHQKIELQRQARLKSKSKDSTQQNKKINLQNRKQDRQLRRAKFINDYLSIQEKQNIVDRINSGKQAGKIKIVRFKQERNKEFIEEYKNQLEKEGKEKNSKLEAIKQLEARQQDLILKLKQSSAQKQTLKQSYQSASRLNLKQLQNCVLENIRKASYNSIGSRTSRASSHSDRRMDHQLELSRDKIYFQRYQKQRRSRLSNTVDVSQNKSMAQSQEELNTPKMSLGDDNIQEELVQAKDDQEKKRVSRVHKRKRNKHINRYKDYEIF